MADYYLRRIGLYNIRYEFWGWEITQKRTPKKMSLKIFSCSISSLALTGKEPSTLSPTISNNEWECKRDDISKFKYRRDGRIVFRKDLCLSIKSLFTFQMFVFTKCNENSTTFYQFTDKTEGNRKCYFFLVSEFIVSMRKFRGSLFREFMMFNEN